VIIYPIELTVQNDRTVLKRADALFGEMRLPGLFRFGWWGESEKAMPVPV
jgi:hypothetical protein